MPRFLIVVDVDSTLIENEVIDLLAAEKGVHEEVSSITEAAMRGEIDFHESLKLRVQTLAGLPESGLAKVRAQVHLTPGAKELIHGVHAAGSRICAVSGGFHEIIDPLAAGLKLDRWRANCLEISDGLLTGKVRGRVIDANAKEVALREWAEVYSVPMSRVVSVGDGANDLAMLGASGLSVAFNAKPSVRAAANIAIDTKDLSQVLPLLGLRG